jgi:hypothetical protein
MGLSRLLPNQRELIYGSLRVAGCLVGCSVGTAATFSPRPAISTLLANAGLLPWIGTSWITTDSARRIVRSATLLTRRRVTAVALKNSDKLRSSGRSAIAGYGDIRSGDGTAHWGGQGRLLGCPDPLPLRSSIKQNEGRCAKSNESLDFHFPAAPVQKVCASRARRSIRNAM